MKLSSAILVSMLGSAATACGGASAPLTGPAGQVTHFDKASGSDDQGWYVNNPTPAPYNVIARDANGRPVGGVIVTWAVASGGGSVIPLVDTTDTSGNALATHTLGPTARVQTVTATASVAGVPAVTFTAFADTAPVRAAIQVQDDEYVKDGVVVRVHGTVSWTWVGMHTHSVTFADTSSATQEQGTFQRTFDVAGTYPYACYVYGMGGVVTVVN